MFGDYLRERGWRYLSVDGSRRGNPSDPREVEFIDLEEDLRELTSIEDRSVQLVLLQHVI